MRGTKPGMLHRVAVCTSAASLWIGLTAAVSTPVVAAEPVRDEAAVIDQAWLDEMGAYDEAHPELKTTRGSGWKPYNRAKWFYEQRMVNGEPVPVGARYRAWEQELAIERTMPVAPRSTWFSLGPANFAGRILSLEFDPDNSSTLYTGTAGGGLWKSTDGGLNWAPLTDDTPSMAIGGVAVLPSNSNIVVIGTGEGTPNIDRISGVGILRSTDAGRPGIPPVSPTRKLTDTAFTWWRPTRSRRRCSPERRMGSGAPRTKEAIGPKCKSAGTGTTWCGNPAMPIAATRCAEVRAPERRQGFDRRRPHLEHGGNGTASRHSIGKTKLAVSADDRAITATSSGSGGVRCAGVFSGGSAIGFL